MIEKKVAYLKGLAEGLALVENKPETKIINAMLDVLDELAMSVTDLEDAMDIFSEQLDAVDEDLDELEEYIFEDDFDDDCDCDCCCDDDDELYEIACPLCGEEILLDEEMLDEEIIECPGCGEKLELDIDFDDCECDCDCGCCDEE